MVTGTTAVLERQIMVVDSVQMLTVGLDSTGYDSTGLDSTGVL
jgi:hypothetical protein